MTGPSLLSWRVDLADISPAALDLTFTASPDERSDLAAANGLIAVNGLSASAGVTRDGSRGVSVEGRIIADIVQTCVVSLVPVEQHIDESFLVRFLEADARNRVPPRPPGGEVVIHADEPDPPEIISGPWIDLGALVEEHFVLAIDHYPRAPGATLPAEAVDSDHAGRDSPFAALSALANDRSPKR
jgi:uncharacterized metal-binding protein YceD (DUF177 family)